MIVVESKRKKVENILKQYPDAIVHDLTSHAEDEFYKTYDLPVRKWLTEKVLKRK